MEEIKRRGRPKKIVEEPLEIGSPKDLISNTLAEWCGLPGCGPKIHHPEADDIIENLQLAGYKITKEDDS